MKKTGIILFLAVVLLSTANTFAQFTPDSKLLSGGFLLGDSKVYNFTIADYTRTGIPPIFVQYESGLSESSFLAEYSRFFTLGYYGSIYTRNFSKDITNNNVSYEVYKKYKAIAAGLLISFHYTSFLNDAGLAIDAEKIDLFANIRPGVKYQMYRSNFYTDPNDLDVLNGYIDDKVNNFEINIGLTLGGRYYFNDKFGLLLEFGTYNTGYMAFGLTYRP